MASNKFRFTKTRLEALLPASAGKRAWYYDEETPGLAFQITASGSRSFYLYRWVEGKPERLRLGGFPAMTVEQARNAIKGHLGEIAKGNNPAEAKRLQKTEMTFRELTGEWMRKHVVQRLRPSSQRGYQQIVDAYLMPKLGTRKLSKITRQDVRKLHDAIETEAGPYAANRSLAVLKAMLNYGRQQLDIPLPSNPAEGVKAFAEEKRERWLGSEEMPRFWEALAQEENPDFRDLFGLALLTGARRSNVCAMTWQDINLNTATWTIPGKDAKAHRPIVVPLAGPAIQILQERKRHMRSDPWVFPGTGATGHIVEPKSAWKRLLQRSGLEDLRLHDLRHSLASWQASMGVSLAIVGKALGHQTTATTARYAHLASDPVRQAMEQAAAAMMGGVNENVLPMKKAK